MGSMQHDPLHKTKSSGTGENFRWIVESGWKGLCPRCGENLNHHPDHHHEPEADPRWAKLSELKLD